MLPTAAAELSSDLGRQVSEPRTHLPDPVRSFTRQILLAETEILKIRAEPLDGVKIVRMVSPGRSRQEKCWPTLVVRPPATVD